MTAREHAEHAATLLDLEAPRPSVAQAHALTAIALVMTDRVRYDAGVVPPGPGEWQPGLFASTGPVEEPGPVERACAGLEPDADDDAGGGGR